MRPRDCKRCGEMVSAADCDDSGVCSNCYTAAGGGYWRDRSVAEATRAYHQRERRAEATAKAEGRQAALELINTRSEPLPGRPELVSCPACGTPTNVVNIKKHGCCVECHRYG